jgi:putrescine transport system substrate-binding protein
VNSVVRLGFVVFLLSALIGCGRHADVATTPPGAEEKVLNVYNWSDYIAADTLANFQKETGIRVRYDVYDSNETLEGKLLAGSTGYDVVVPSAPFLERQIKAGVYRPFDKAKLPNLKNMDPDIMQRLAAHDPGNAHAVDYMWGTTGIGYNVDKIKKLMPTAPVDSWRMVFDPDVVKNFQACGVTLLDSASEMTDMVLAYLGKDPHSDSPEDLAAVEATLHKIRPYIKYIHSSRYIADLASGEICLVVGYNGDILQARERALENHTGAIVAYSIPNEGTLLWMDSMAIPQDAPHPDNAHVFINYMMRPEIIAEVSNTTQYANGNAAAMPLVKESVRNDPGVYPPPQVKAKLFPNLARDENAARAVNRMWTRFMTGQ